MNKTLMVFAIGLTAGVCRAEMAVAPDDSVLDERSWKWSPLGVGIAAPVQLPFVSTDIWGVRLGGLFGYNHDVYGLDCGVAEVTSGRFAGLQASAMSWTLGSAFGVQCSALANVVKGSTIALQAGFANVVWEDAGGIQLGCVNYTTDFRGLQVGGIINWNELATYGLEISLLNANQMEFAGWAFGGLVNYADTFTGFSCGLVNVAYDFTGCQIGLINACDHMHGVQFGVINMICGSRLPIMVVANAWF